jgi:hypothetical protein
MLVSPFKNHRSSWMIERRCSFLVVSAGNPVGQVKAHLVPEHAARAGAGPVVAVKALIENQAQEVMILLHGGRLMIRTESRRIPNANPTTGAAGHRNGGGAFEPRSGGTPVQNLHSEDCRQVPGNFLPFIALIQAGKHRAGVGAEIDARRLARIACHGLAQDGEIAVLLRQAAAQVLPACAAIARPPDRSRGRIGRITAPRLSPLSGSVQSVSGSLG